MPRHPRLSPVTRPLAGSLYSAYARRLAHHPGETYPLHVGDTWLEPVEGARMEDLAESALPGLHRYANPGGLPQLRGALLRKVREGNGFDFVEKGGVMIGTGCTGALAALAATLLSPGEEVLLCAPYWPLVRAVVLGARARTVDVPFYDRAADPEALAEALQEAVSPRTAVIYVSSPSNPTGCVLEERALAVVADFARQHDLWIWSDEVYEDFVYDARGAGHVSLAPLAPERTFTGFSFSKAYAMAGNRVGYVAGDAAVLRAARKVATAQVYAVNHAAQWGAVRALERGEGWLAQARSEYAAAGRRAARILEVPPPQGGTFLFVDVGRVLDSRGLDGFLEDCLEDGLLLAPGPSFGRGWERWARLCFTAVPPDRMDRGVRRLRRRLGAAPGAFPGTDTARSPAPGRDLDPADPEAP